MGDLVEITTWPKHFDTYYKITSNALVFEIKASGNAALALSRKQTKSCDILIVLGERQQSWMRVYAQPWVSANTPRILSADEYRKFWLTWSNGFVRLGREGCSDTIVSSAHDLTDLKYVTFSVYNQSNPVQWRFELPPPLEKTRFTAIKAGDLQWVTFHHGQDLPEELLVGGIEKENLYIARAKHRGSVIPGKYARSVKKAYIPWEGRSIEKPKFELLCGFDGFWFPTCKDKIPVGAFVAGYLEETLERLYIGRAKYKGHLIPGKVAPSLKACYIPYEGKEVTVTEFEVLISPKENDRCVNKMFISDRVSADRRNVIDVYGLPDSDYNNESDEDD